MPHTKSSQDVIAEYKKTAYNTPALKKQEEIELIRAYKNSPPDSDAAQATKTKIINAFLRTVISLAEKYCYRNNLSPLDLIQCGIVGIMTALERFELEKYKVVTENTGSLFAYFVYRWMLKEMNDFYRKNVRAVAVSDATNTRLQKINNLYKKGKLNVFYDDSAGVQTEELIRYLSEDLKVAEQEIRMILPFFKSPLELDSTKLGGEGEEMGWHERKDFHLKTYETKTPRVIHEENDRNKFLLEEIDRLAPDERALIMFRYGINCEIKGIEEIAADTGRSASFTAQRIRRIQEKLKNMMGEKVAAADSLRNKSGKSEKTGKILTLDGI